MAGYQMAKPGDILLLHAGRYHGPFELRKSGRPGRPIVLRGAGNGEAVLEARGTGEKADVVRISGVDHVMFENLTFRKGRTAI